MTTNFTLSNMFLVTYFRRKLFLKVATRDLMFQDCYFGPNLVDSEVTKFCIKVHIDSGQIVVTT